MKKLLPIFLAVLGVMLAPPDASSEGAAKRSIQAVKVLIITPNPKIGFSAGIKELLKEHDIHASVASFTDASPELADEYDLLIMTGTGQAALFGKMNESQVRLDYDKPMLAYGPRGSDYLDFLDLKNGAGFS